MTSLSMLILVPVVVLMSIPVLLCSVTSSTKIVEYGQEVEILCPYGMPLNFMQMITGKSFELLWSDIPVQPSISFFNEKYKFAKDGSNNVLRIPSLDDDLVGRYECGCIENGEETCLLFDVVVFLGYKYTSCDIMEMEFYGIISNNSLVRNLEKNGELYSATITSNVTSTEETIVFNVSSQINDSMTKASTILVGNLQNSNCSSPVKKVVTRSPLSDTSDGRNEEQSGRIATSSSAMEREVTSSSALMSTGDPSSSGQNGKQKELIIAIAATISVLLGGTVACSVK